jgi:hypothetical protein
MNKKNKMLPWILCVVTAGVLTMGTAGLAQAKPAVPAQQAAAPAPTEQEVVATQEQLLKLLRLSPTLTTVVASDPSLLAEQAYVARNNPQLAQFLAQHPEVVRNPEFYLFTNLNSEGGRRDQALKRAVWPDLVPEQRRSSSTPAEIVGPIAGAVAFACFLVALVWLIRLLLENLRWSRTSKQQSAIHARLIEKFSSSQELAAYMETEAGKRFFEAAPIPAPEQRVPNAVARVLTPLQVGTVLILLGTGLLLLRNASPEMNLPMLVLGTVILMPGIGFILSAGITWVLAGRLGLMPVNSTAPKALDSPSDSQDRQ